MIIRASDVPVKIETQSIFTYCAAYRNLTWGHLDYQLTPVIPSWPFGVPQKFILIPSKNRNHIIETGVHLQYIEDILHKAVQYDPNVRSMGLFSPNDFALGYVSASGKFYQGKDIPSSENIWTLDK